MTDVSDVLSDLVTYLQSDTTLAGLVDSITTDAGYNSVPRGMRIHVRPVNNNANERAVLGGRIRDVVIGFVLVGRHAKLSNSDVGMFNVIERLDKLTWSFVSQSEHTNKRASFDYDIEMADDYPETRIEFASVSYTIVEV